MQRCLEQEVGLEESHLATLALRSKCRKLENEALFADVFEKYEQEIRQLQVALAKLSHFDRPFNQTLALCDIYSQLNFVGTVRSLCIVTKIAKPSAEGITCMPGLCIPIYHRADLW